MLILATFALRCWRCLAALGAWPPSVGGSGVGFIALADCVAAEFGVIMLLYLRRAWDASVANSKATDDDLLNAIHHGAVYCAYDQSHDRRSDRGGAIWCHHDRRRYELGGDAAYRRADGGWHGHGHRYCRCLSSPPPT